MINSILNLGISLSNVQKAIDVTSDNISNSATPGYIEKRGNFNTLSDNTQNYAYPNPGITFEIQNPNIMARMAASEVSNSASNNSAIEQQTTNYKIYNPLLKTFNISDSLIKLQDAHPNDILTAKFNLGDNIKAQLEEYQRVSESLSNKGPMAMNKGNINLIDQANIIYDEYQTLSKNDPNNPKLSELEAKYAVIAGVPPIPLSNTSDASGGQILGNNKSIIDLNNSKNNLNQSFNQFKDFINGSLGDNIISGDSSSSSFDKNKINLVKNIGDNNYEQSYNSVIGSYTGTLNAKTEFSKDKFVNKFKDFQSQYGVNDVQQITQLTTLQNLHSAITKVIIAQDDMMKETLSIIR